MGEEKNGNKIGGWEYDVFITESGNLGFTVYPKHSNPVDEDTPCVDIYVDTALSVKHS